MTQGQNKRLLHKKVKKGMKGHPIATVAFYGPDNATATKLVCEIISSEAGEIAQKSFINTHFLGKEKREGCSCCLQYGNGFRDQSASL